ncbi:MAG: flavin reductase family protein, partial [Candidatus Bathyarchaeia archaeon]
KGKALINIPLTKAVRLISPRLTILVNTVDRYGNLNSAPYSWVYPLSFNPPLIGIGIGGKHKHTYINSKISGEFVVCVVSEDFAQQAVNCEEKHKPEENLLEKNGLHIEESKKVSVPRVKESKAILECKVKGFLEFGGDHLILIGEVVYAEAECLNNEINLDAIKPILHVYGEKFRSVGKEIILERKTL